jgi:hypothetical protein
MPTTKLSDVKEGNILVADAGFDCLTAGKHEVHRSPDGLYIRCEQGRHYLDGQVDRENNLVGLVAIDPEPATTIRSR